MEADAEHEEDDGEASDGVGVVRRVDECERVGPDDGAGDDVGGDRWDVEAARDERGEGCGGEDDREVDDEWGGVAGGEDERGESWRRWYWEGKSSMASCQMADVHARERAIPQRHGGHREKGEVRWSGGHGRVAALAGRGTRGVRGFGGGGSGMGGGGYTRGLEGVWLHGMGFGW